MRHLASNRGFAVRHCVVKLTPFNNCLQIRVIYLFSFHVPVLKIINNILQLYKNVPNSVNLAEIFLVSKF